MIADLVVSVITLKMHLHTQNKEPGIVTTVLSIRIIERIRTQELREERGFLRSGE